MARLVLLSILFALVFAGRYNDLTYRGVVYSGAASNTNKLPGQLTTDFIFPNNDTLQFFFNAGLNLVRIPVLWERFQPTLNAPLDPTYTGYLDRTVAYITSKGATAWISVDNGLRYNGTVLSGDGSTSVPYSALADLWSKLATRYLSNSKVAFGIMNEPNTTPTQNVFNATQAAITAIRATGATQIIFVDGNGWSGAHSWFQNWYGKANANVLGALQDPAKNLVFDMHQFLDKDFSSQSPVCQDINFGVLVSGATFWLRDNGYRGIIGATALGPNQKCFAAGGDLMAHLYANSDVWLGFAYAGAGWVSDFYSLFNSTDGTTTPQWNNFLKLYTNSTAPQGLLPSSLPALSSTLQTGSRLQYRGVSQAGGEFNHGKYPGVANEDWAFPTTSSLDFFSTTKGINLVRVPFSWERAVKTPGAALEDSYISYLDAAVQGVLSRGQTVLIDCHNYFKFSISGTDTPIGSTAVPVSSFVDLWIKLGAKYANNTKVWFGLMNEPFGVDTTDVASASQSVITAIRAAGYTNTIAVDGNRWSGAHSWTSSSTDYPLPNGVAFKSLKDPLGKTIFDMHQYMDADSSGTTTLCTSRDWATTLDNTTKWLRDNQFKAIIGEWGTPQTQDCYNNAGNFMDYLNKNSDVWIGQIYWAAGPMWGSYFMGVEPRLSLSGDTFPTAIWTDVVSKFATPAAADSTSQTQTKTQSTKSTPTNLGPSGAGHSLAAAALTIAIAVAACL